VPRKRILLAEENEFNRALVAQILEGEYEIFSVVDGAAAVAMALAERPDLILMDMGLPMVDGWEATRRIKEH